MLPHTLDLIQLMSAFMYKMPISLVVEITTIVEQHTCLETSTSEFTIGGVPKPVCTFAKVLTLGGFFML